MANDKITAEIAIFEPVDKEKVKSQIYEIRGYRVMLDSDIAEYFGVTTGNLNKAMKRNIRRFPSNFCFQLTKEEDANLIFQSGISSSGGNYGGRRTLPYAYTEQGVAMLTSTLHTDRAIQASVAIMDAFVEMAHYLRATRQMLPYEEIRQIDSRVSNIEANMVTKADLSDFMKLFDSARDAEEILILNGQPFKADDAYQKIYRKAKKSIIVIDDYIGVKTLRHLATAKKAVAITIISDNKGRSPLRKAEYDDFTKEYIGRNISFIKSQNKTHDRYIILDNGTNDMKIYLAGSSSKDSGNKITTIMQVKDISEYKAMIKNLLTNPELNLK